MRRTWWRRSAVLLCVASALAVTPSAGAAVDLFGAGFALAALVLAARLLQRK